LTIRAINKALAVLAAGAFFWLLFSLRPTDFATVLSLEGATMGTRWNVQVVTTTPDQEAEALTGPLQDLMHRLDREIFSTWNPDSELSRFNRSEVGVPQPVSPELLQVLLLSQQINLRSLQGFDAAIGSLVNAWGFGPEPAEAIPTPEVLAQAVANSGMSALALDPAAGTLRRDKAVLLDLSAIAKGFAVDKVAELLQARGHSDFLVEIGGELRLQGHRPDGLGWRIAVEAPQEDVRTVFARIDSAGEAMALAGSGDYRNFREVEGKRYSHTIDPRTGYPVDHEMSSVTLVAASAAEADGWATALMVLGPEQGLAVADGEGLAAYFIIRGPSGLEQRHTAAFTRFLYQQEGSR